MNKHLILATLTASLLTGCCRGDCNPDSFIYLNVRLDGEPVRPDSLSMHNEELDTEQSCNDFGLCKLGYDVECTIEVTVGEETQSLECADMNHTHTEASRCCGESHWANGTVLFETAQDTGLDTGD